ncbi:MAG: 30S ribosomal protein S17 [Puniceicoccales bacterium]|jgi:small subunit ribosomal protein S17|nr:30S ribosomal protein S17 [Puniceicoccales bacterium]
MSEGCNSRKNARKRLVGIVTGRCGDKTIKVSYSYKVPHVLYRKEIRRRTLVYVHDQNNECSLGDEIEIIETRPLSKLKRWRFVGTVKKAPVL